MITMPVSPTALLTRTLSQDFLASIVVFLVALPLCMGIALACGYSAGAGVLTGIVGGLLVGLLSGCPLQVSGPAAGLVVLVADLLHDHGPEKLASMILIAGVFQVLAGFFNAAKWFRAVTPSIVNGMLTGIGVLIFASQFHVMVDDSPKGNGLINLISIPSAILKGLTPNSSSSHEEAAALGVITILALVLWDKFAPMRLRVLPGSLIGVTVATIIAAFYSFPVHFVSLPGSLLQVIHLPTAASFFPSLCDREIIFGAMAIALIASTETLLTATAIDKMHSGARTNYERELTAQGIGNIICGFLGILPMTGVMVRSGVNVAAGAKTRLSSILHGCWLLLFVTLLPFWIKLIPVASLAALLVFTGYKLANFKIAKELRKYGKFELAIYIVTVVFIVTTDLLTGVLVGLAAATAKLLYTFSHLEIQIAEDLERNRTEVWLHGSATFLSLPKFASRLESINQGSEVHLHFDGLDYIDHACLDLLTSWNKQQQATGGKVFIDWNALGAVFKDRRRTKRSKAISQTPILASSHSDPN